MRRCQEKGVVSSRLYLRARSLGLDEAPGKRSVQFWNSVWGVHWDTQYTQWDGQGVVVRRYEIAEGKIGEHSGGGWGYQNAWEEWKRRRARPSRSHKSLGDWHLWKKRGPKGSPLERRQCWGEKGILIKAGVERRKQYAEVVNRSQALEATCIQPHCDQWQKITAGFCELSS